MKIMLVLSSLFALMYTIVNFLIMLLKNNVVSYINNNMGDTYFYFWKENFLFFISANRTLYVLCFLTGLSLLYGCFLMWRGYKWGLFFYTLGKIFQIFLPIAFLGTRMLAIGDIMMAILFLVFYYVYSLSHQMEKQERKYFKYQ